MKKAILYIIITMCNLMIIYTPLYILYLSGLRGLLCVAGLILAALIIPLIISIFGLYKYVK